MDDGGMMESIGVRLVSGWLADWPGCAFCIGSNHCPFIPVVAVCGLQLRGGHAARTAAVDLLCHKSRQRAARWGWTPVCGQRQVE